MKFKDFINLKERLDFGREIELLIKDNMIPISPKMMIDLGYSFGETESAYHMTNAGDLKNFKKISPKAQLSCFTNPSLELSKLPSNPNIVLKLSGRPLIKGESDLYTFLDKDGRRWIKLDTSSDGKKLMQQVKYISEEVFKNKKYNISLYRNYLKKINKLLDSGGYKLLNKHIKNITFNYNEIIMDNINIEGAWDFNANKREDIIKNNIKYLGYLTPSDLLKL